MTLNRNGFLSLPQRRPAALAERSAWIMAMLGAAGLSQAALAPAAHAINATGMTDVQRGNALLERIQSGGSFTVEDGAGPSGVPLALNIRLPRNPAHSYSFLMFRNLPEQFKLSAGFGAKDYWAVSLNDAEGLRLIPPAEFQGMFAIDVLLIRGKDVEPERRRVNIAFTDGGAAETTASIQPAPAPRLPTVIRPEAAVSPPADLPRERVAVRSEGLTAREMTDADRLLMERGNSMAAQGDVASARLLYLQVARKGVAAGALAMGRSFDPEFLANLNVRGLQPDIAQARNWYRTAADLGSDQASRYLSALTSR